MIQHIDIILDPYPKGYHLITNELKKAIGSLPSGGILHIFIKHTSAAITINENADPTVRNDFETIFNQLVPENEPYYTHIFEGSDDMPAHIKASIIGNSISIPIRNHKLDMGIWQGIYLCEFRRHGGRRKMVATIFS